MAREVVFLNDAIRDLNELYDYISENAGPITAIRYVRRIREQCFALAYFPERGRSRDDIAPHIRILSFERRVNIAFRVLKTRVEIVTIAYGGRSFGRGPQLR